MIRMPDRSLLPGPARWAAAAMAALPLVLAYLALPLARVAGGAGLLLSPWLWFGLGLTGSLAAALQVRSGAARTLSALLGLLVFCVLLVFYGEPLLRGSLRPGWLAELKIPAFLLLAGMWALTFGPPDRRVFLILGALLGAFCLGDFAGHWLGPTGLLPARLFGRPDLLACLLLVAFSAGLSAKGEDRPGRPAGLCLALCLAGMAACLSRMALFTAGWGFLFFGPAKRGPRVAVFALCLALVGLSLALPTDRAVQFAQLERAWEWLAVLRALTDQPLTLLTGLPLARELPLRLPESLSLLVGVAGRGLALRPAELHAFWLHMLAAWGLVAAPALAALLAFPALRRPTAFAAGVLSTALGMGLVMELFSSPEATLAVVLGLLAATARTGTGGQAVPGPSGARTAPEAPLPAAAAGETRVPDRA